MTVPLDYDTLPPHSQLRREFGDGILKITAAPEEPGLMVRRAALLGAAVFAAMVFWIVMLVGFAIFGSMYLANRQNISPGLGVILGIAFSVLCAALFGLLWRTQYVIRLDAARKALLQTTVLAASRGRLVIETSGSVTTASHDWRDAVRAIRIARHSMSMQSLEIELTDGSTIRLLHGRDQPELQWVARAIDRAMRS